MGQGWNRKDNSQGDIVSTAFEESFFCWKLLGETDFLKYDVWKFKMRILYEIPSRELTYPLLKAFWRWLFLFPRWDMLVSWKVFRYSRCTYHIDTQIHNDIHVIWCRPKCRSYVLQTSALSTPHLCPEKDLRFADRNLPTRHDQFHLHLLTRPAMTQQLWRKCRWKPLVKMWPTWKLVIF